MILYIAIVLARFKLIHLRCSSEGSLDCDFNNSFEHQKMCTPSTSKQPACGWIVPPRIDDFSTYVFLVLPTGRLIPGKATIGGNSLAFLAMETQSYSYSTNFCSNSSHTSLLNLYCIDCVTVHSCLEEPRFQHDELIILRALGVAPDDTTLSAINAEFKAHKGRVKDESCPLNFYHCFGAINPCRSKKTKYRVLNLSFLRKIISYRSSYLLSDNCKVKSNSFLSSPILIDRFSQLVTARSGVHRYLKIRLYDESVLIFFGLPRKIDALMNQLNKTLLSSHTLQVGKKISTWEPRKTSLTAYFPNATEVVPSQNTETQHTSKDGGHNKGESNHDLGSNFSIVTNRRDPSLPIIRSASQIAISTSLEYTGEHEVSHAETEMTHGASSMSHIPSFVSARSASIGPRTVKFQSPVETSMVKAEPDRLNIGFLSQPNLDPISQGFGTKHGKQASFSGKHFPTEGSSHVSSVQESQSSDTITEDSNQDNVRGPTNYLSSSGTEDFTMYVYEPCLDVDSEILRRRCRKFRSKKLVTMTAREKAIIQADSNSILSYMTSKTEKEAKRNIYDKKYSSSSKPLWPGTSDSVYISLKQFCASSKTREKQFFKSIDSKLWKTPEDSIAKQRHKNKDLSDSDLAIDLPVMSLLQVRPSKHMRKSFSRENIESLQQGIESLNDMLKHDSIVVGSSIMQTVYNTHKTRKGAPIIPTNRGAHGILSIERQTLERGLADVIKECMDAICLQITNSDIRKSLEIERMRRGSLEYVSDGNLVVESSSSRIDDSDNDSAVNTRVVGGFSLAMLYFDPERDVDTTSKSLCIRQLAAASACSNLTSHGMTCNITNSTTKTGDGVFQLDRRSKLLTTPLIKELLVHLPPEYHSMGTSISKYKVAVIYSMNFDGRHLSHLYAAMNKCARGDIHVGSPSSTQRLVYDTASLLLIQTTNMQVCGVFMTQPVGMIGIPNGTSDNFVFSHETRGSVEDSSQATKVYHTTGKNTIFQVRQEEMLTFGAGGGSAVVLYGDMYYAQTGQSETYGNDFLFSGEDFPRFKRQQVLNVELLSFIRLKNK